VLLPEELGRRRPKASHDLQARPILLALPNLFGTSNKTVDPHGKSFTSLLMYGVTPVGSLSADLFDLVMSATFDSFTPMQHLDSPSQIDGMIAKSLVEPGQ
jgi:hypothetical protein